MPDFDWGFWIIFGVPFICGWLARSHLEHARRADERDRAMTRHPSRIDIDSLWVIDDGWTDRG